MRAAALRVTETGGRSATTRHIPPKLALAVGMPTTPAPKDWRWSALTDLARLESGHTPSRKHPEYWGGAIPWIGIGDARAHDGRTIEDTEEKTNELGIENSSARVLPANTVCLSRTASVGYVVVMGRPMATSQDFVNWACSKQLDHNFLKYLFIAEGEDLLRFSSGAVHQTIYFPEVKAFHICHPPLAEQQRIVGLLDEQFAGLAIAQANAEKNRQNARALFESHLQSVFTERGSGWVDTALGDVCSFVRGPFGGSLKKSMFVADGYAVYEQQHAIYDQFDDVRYFIDEAKFKEMKRFELLPGDLIMSCSGTMGRVAIVPSEIKRGIINQALLKLTPSSNILNTFLKSWMESEAFQDALKEYSGGAAIQNVASVKILKEIKVLLPSMSDQTRVVEELDALREEIQRLVTIYERKLAALAALKQSLLHHAFTGNL